MVIRAYEPTYPPIKMPDEVKRKRVVLEKRGISRILIDESIGTVFLYKTDEENPEAFAHSGYRLEICEGEPYDGITEGLTLVD